VEFRRWGGTIADKVRKLQGIAGASKSNIGNWQAGTALPSGPMRERIYELGGPDPDSWDEGHDGLVTEPTPPRSAAVTSDDTAQAAKLLLAHIQRQQTELDASGSTIELGARSRIAANLAAMVDKLGHHTGVKITRRQILDSPELLPIVDRIVEALEPWPEAMRAVADAISELKVQS
jgi:hypothetical protein